MDYLLADYCIKGMLKQLSTDNEIAYLPFDTAIGYLNKYINSSSTTVEEKDKAKLLIATCLGQKSRYFNKEWKGRRIHSCFS